MLDPSTESLPKYFHPFVKEFLDKNLPIGTQVKVREECAEMIFKVLNKYTIQLIHKQLNVPWTRYIISKDSFDKFIIKEDLRKRFYITSEFARVRAMIKDKENQDGKSRQ